MGSDARKVNDVEPDLAKNFGDEVPGAGSSFIRKRRSQVSRHTVRCDGIEIGLPGS